MPHIAHLLCILLLACLSPMALGERLRLVSDDWAPYVYRDGGRVRGIDYEVTTEVFRRLGVEVYWQFLPWKRCLALVEQGHADGVMDIFQLESRKAYMVLSGRTHVACRVRAVSGQRPAPCHPPAE